MTMERREFATYVIKLAGGSRELHFSGVSEEEAKQIDAAFSAVSEVEALRAMLGELQWIGYDMDEWTDSEGEWHTSVKTGLCPICHFAQAQHSDDCRLAALLGRKPTDSPPPAAGTSP